MHFSCYNLRKEYITYSYSKSSQRNEYNSVFLLQTIILIPAEDPAGEFTFPTDLNLKQLESGGEDDSEYKDKSILWTLNLDRLDQILRSYRYTSQCLRDILCLAEDGECGFLRVPTG